MTRSDGPRIDHTTFFRPQRDRIPWKRAQRSEDIVVGTHYAPVSTEVTSSHAYPHYKISSFGANIFQIPSSFVIRLDRRGLFRNTFDHRRGRVHLSVSVKRKRQCEYYHMKKSNYELWVPFIICNQFRVLDCRPIANDTKLIEVCLRHVICDGKISNQ